MVRETIRHIKNIIYRVKEVFTEDPKTIPKR